MWLDEGKVSKEGSKQFKKISKAHITCISIANIHNTVDILLISQMQIVTKIYN